MLNKGLTNFNASKAVPCDLISEIFKLKEIILKKDDYAASLYPEYNEKYFLDYLDDNCKREYYANEDTDLGNCVLFLESSEFGVEKDVQIYSCEYYFNKEGKYQGICKLPNGADIIVFNAFCEEQPSNMCKVLYFDGEKLRIFTPFEGNAVNVVLKTCLLDEDYTIMHPFEGKLYEQIYPNGLDRKELPYDEFVEQAREGYAKFLGIDYDDFYDGGFQLDWDAICNEIERVLS